MSAAQKASHAPSTPFGCPKSWGPPLGGVLPIDMLRHICTIEQCDHDGPCRCACGSVAGSGETT